MDHPESLSTLASAAEAAQPTHQFLCLAIGEERYAVRIDGVREILEVSRMTPVPLMPGFVRGVMNLRGAVVPVIDIGARLGLARTEIGRRTCVVIVDIALPEEQGTQRLGMLVDAVFEVFDAAIADQELVPRFGTRIDAAFLRSIVRVRGRATPELDIGTILDLDVLAGLIAAHAPEAPEPVLPRKAAPVSGITPLASAGLGALAAA